MDKTPNNDMNNGYNDDICSNDDNNDNNKDDNNNNDNNNDTCYNNNNVVLPSLCYSNKTFPRELITYDLYASSFKLYQSTLNNHFLITQERSEENDS